MPAPAASVLQAPTGIKLSDGFRALIGFSALPAWSVWTKSLTPPSLEGGEGVEQTTMHNVDVHTALPRSIIKIGNLTVKVAYDPNVYSAGQLFTLINRNNTVTVQWRDGTTLAMFAALVAFKPDALEEGKQPEATMEILVTNIDPVSGGEYKPVVSSVAGT